MLYNFYDHFKVILTECESALISSSGKWDELMNQNLNNNECKIFYIHENNNEHNLISFLEHEMFTGSGYLFSVVCWVPPSAPFMNMNTRTRLMEFSVHCWYLPRIHNTMITVLNFLNFDINIFKEPILRLSCKWLHSRKTRKHFAGSLEVCERPKMIR